MRYVALLRGVNVGGKNKLPMKDLAALFAAAACTEVETYIQSGNVVFEAPRGAESRLPALLGRELDRRFGLKVPVVMRTAAELRDVVVGCPVTGHELEHLHVAFLADRPDARRVATLDPERSPPDTFRVRGREIYLHLPNGVARTRLTNAYLDATLATTSTLRNWRTVQKLLELVRR